MKHSQKKTERIFHLYNKNIICVPKKMKNKRDTARHCTTLRDTARRTQTLKNALGEQAKTCVKHEAAKTAGKQNDFFCYNIDIKLT